MKRKTIEFSGTCGACGANMTLKGYRESNELPAPSSVVRKEFIAAKALTGKTFREIEKECGVSNAVLCQFANEMHDTQSSTLDRIIEWLRRQK